MSRRQLSEPDVEEKLASSWATGTKLITLERVFVVLALGAAVWFVVGLLFAVGLVNTGGGHVR